VTSSVLVSESCRLHTERTSTLESNAAVLTALDKIVLFARRLTGHDMPGNTFRIALECLLDDDISLSNERTDIRETTRHDEKVEEEKDGGERHTDMGLVTNLTAELKTTRAIGLETCDLSDTEEGTRNDGNDKVEETKAKVQGVTEFRVHSRLKDSEFLLKSLEALPALTKLQDSLDLASTDEVHDSVHHHGVTVSDSGVEIEIEHDELTITALDLDVDARRSLFLLVALHVRLGKSPLCLNAILKLLALCSRTCEDTLDQLDLSVVISVSWDGSMCSSELLLSIIALIVPSEVHRTISNIEFQKSINLSLCGI